MSSATQPYSPDGASHAPPWEHPAIVNGLSPWQMYVGLSGRIGRRDFWLYGVLALLVVGMVLMALLEIAGFYPDRSERIANLIIAWPAIAVSVKRWHDRDKSGWWVLIVLVPIIGQLWALIDNGFMPGTRGANRFGGEPR